MDMEISARENKLFAQWELRRRDLVRDGVVDEAAFSKSRPKVLFLLKEVNSPGHGGWDLREFIRRDAGQPQTWDLVTRWVLGIKNIKNDAAWAELETITPQQRREALVSVVLMNLKKTPGGQTSNDAELKRVAREDSDLLKQQYRLYDPDLVVCCGSIVAELFEEVIQEPPSGPWASTKRGIRYKQLGSGKYVVGFSHPEARVDHSLLYYGLVDAVREILGGHR
jgi:hypothetical protein